jgi:hypothetical protein
MAPAVATRQRVALSRIRDESNRDPRQDLAVQTDPDKFVVKHSETRIQVVDNLACANAP